MNLKNIVGFVHMPNEDKKVIIRSTLYPLINKAKFGKIGGYLCKPSDKIS